MRIKTWIKNVDVSEAFFVTISIALLIVAVLVIAWGFMVTIPLLSKHDLNYLCSSRNNVSQECVEYRYTQCLKSEVFSQDECLILAK